MVTFSKNALPLLIAGVSVTFSSAFVPSTKVPLTRISNVGLGIATTPGELGISSPADMKQNNNNGDNENDNRNGAMMDLEGIAFSVSTLYPSYHSVTTQNNQLSFSSK